MESRLTRVAARAVRATRRTIKPTVACRLPHHHQQSVASSSVTQTIHFNRFHSSARPFAGQSSVPAADGTIEFNLADIGEGIAECELIRWFVEPGARIAQFDKVCEVQSDKANVEITSRFDGVIKKLHYKAGELAKVGSPLMTIQLEGDVQAVNGSSNQPSTQIGEHDFSKSPAGHQMNDPSARVLSDTLPPSRSPEFADMIERESLSHEHVEATFGKVLTSPAVRRIAKEEGIDLTKVKGTGPQGRILKEDVQNFAKKPVAAACPLQQAQSNKQSASQSAPSSVTPAAPRAGYLSADVTIPISGLQRIMVQTMTTANAIPHFTYSDEIQMDALATLRSDMKAQLEKQHNIKLTFMPFKIKALSLALKSFPQLNAHTQNDCTSVIHRASHNIGLAMDTPRGLLVPNIKNVQNMNIVEIAREMNRLQQLGKEGKLGRDDLTGGTITLSNVGVIGGISFAPVLVAPELVIGALGAMRTLPRFNDKGEVIPAKIMGVSFSGDHRVVDGATMARFVSLWKQYLEKPQLMLAEMS